MTSVQMSITESTLKNSPRIRKERSFFPGMSNEVRPLRYHEAFNKTLNTN